MAAEPTPVEMDSILLTVAPMAGASLEFMEDDDAFKVELITAINGNLGKLNQLGVGIQGFHIEDETAVWEDFFGDFTPDYKKWMIREYMKFAIKKSFDPPNSSTLLQVINEQMSEYEFRLLVDQDD